MQNFWAAKLGIDPAQLGAPGTHVVVLEDLKDFVLEYRLLQTSLVCVPPNLEAVASARFTNTNAALEPDRMIALFPALLERRWEDYVWYTGERPALQDTPIRALTTNDAQQLEELRAACSEIERDTGDVEISQHSVIGWLETGALLSAASLIVEGQIADVGVLTHPDHRGRGLGKAVVTALIHRALEAGLTVQYMTQQENTGSRRIAAALRLTPFFERRGFRVLST